MTGRTPSLLSRAVKRSLLALYHLKGWKIEGTRPAARKFVITGAPHTSNWDFVFFLGATHELGIEPSFMGKHTLFDGPQRRFMLDMGGVPIDRSKRANTVGQVADVFARADELALVVAPEGSRTSDGHWRTGVYHIAMAAGVPIVPAWVNHTTMRGGIGPAIMPTGDMAADLAKLADFYRSVLPDCPRFEVLAEQARQLGGDTGAS